MRQTGSSGGYSTFTNSERKTFVRYVNDCMSSDQSWALISVDPLDPDNELLDRFQDGKVLWYVYIIHIVILIACVCVSNVESKAVKLFLYKFHVTIAYIYIVHC